MAQSHQNRIHATVSAFQSASEGMITALERLNDSAAIETPAGGGWNAAQIGYHVATTNEYLTGILTGAIPRARPAPDGFQENAKAFSGLPSKVETFESLEPPAEATRAEALEKLRESTAQAVKAIEGLDAERALGRVVDFPFGVISLYQLAEFLGGHVMRHQAQLQRAAAGV
jgi:uncharacterized damage-inducible protein DinB